MTVQRVCVITVCLNARDSIRLTLESVKRQTFAHVDHVIVDGMSNDDTLEIVKEYAVTRVVSEKDKGVYDAMEKARGLATGDIAIYLNAGDVFFDDDVCTDVAAFFDRTKADIVFGNLMPVYLRASDKHDHPAFKPGHLVDGSGMRDLAQLYDSSIHHQATFYRTKLLREVSYICPTPSGTGEYNLLLNAVMRKKAKVKYVPRTISRFALGGISTLDISKEWSKFSEGRDALRQIYFHGKRPTHGAGYFVAENLAYRLKRWKARIRDRISPVQMIKNSPLFSLYSRGLRSMAYRATTEATGQLNVILDRKVGPLHQSLAQIDQRFAILAHSADGINQLVHLNSQQSDHNFRTLANLTHALADVRNRLGDIEKQLCEINRATDRAGALLGKTVARLPGTDSFSTAGYSVTSQFDEDGLIDYLVSRLPGIPPFFVEIGIGNYREANTRYLLEQRNWRGVVMDSDSAGISELKHSMLYWRQGVIALHTMVDRDNVDELVSRYAPGREIGLLSIDVDGVDYWLWDAIKSNSPWIVICEFNGIFGPDAPVTIPYRPDFDRTKAHYSWTFGGTSIGALKHLAGLKGYTLIGTNSGRNNSFFVRNDLLAASAIRVEPYQFRLPNFREARNPDGSMSLLYIEDAFKLIGDLEVVDVRDGRRLKVKDAVDPASLKVG